MTLVARFLADRGGDVASLYDEVLVPALIHTGQEWQEDRISVAHEHYISEVTRDLILRHGPRIWASPNAVKGTAVACCAPQERHVLGLMMASDILRAAGLDVHLLGEGAPSESIRDFVAEFRANVLALSISLPEHLDEAAWLIQQSRSVSPSLLVIAGGRALSELDDPRSRIGADFVACDLRALHRELPALLRNRLGSPS
jgi:methanogenic corrinoid protein MtbC1